MALTFPNVVFSGLHVRADSRPGGQDPSHVQLLMAACAFALSLDLIPLPFPEAEVLQAAEGCCPSEAQMPLSSRHPLTSSTEWWQGD